MFDKRHAQCSEPFYAASIRQAIAEDPKASAEERDGMMKILQRFERGGPTSFESGNNDTDADTGPGALEFQDLLKSLGESTEETDSQEEEDLERQQLMEALADVDLG